MHITLARWGNSLAIRLPAAYLRSAGLKVGDTLVAELGAAGELTLLPAPDFDKTAFLARVRRNRERTVVAEPAVESARAEPAEAESAVAALRAEERY